MPLRTTLVAALLTAALLAGASLPAVAEGPQCLLRDPASDALPASACLACHPARGHQHPVDVDYARVGGRRGYRPAEEVVRRGVLLPGGRIQCVTCHDPTSPWQNHIALPPGATPTPAVDPRDPSTYAGGRSWRTAAPEAAPPPGAAVTASPLCAVCHAFGS